MFPNDKDLDNVVAILKMLADPTRLKIVFALMEGDKCVGDLVRLVGQLSLQLVIN